MARSSRRDCPSAPVATLPLSYAQDQQYARALPWAEKVLALDPANAQARQLVTQLRGRL